MQLGHVARALLYAVSLATGEAANAGDITGSVSFAGAAPQRPKTPITIDQYICGKEKDAEDLVLGPKGGVQHAVVWIDNPPAGAKWPAELPKVEMDQKGCVFVPRVAVVPLGGTVDFLNSDRLLHNLHSLSKDNAQFNRTQPRRQAAAPRSPGADRRARSRPCLCTRRYSARDARRAKGARRPRRRLR